MDKMQVMLVIYIGALFLFLLLLIYFGSKKNKIRGVYALFAAIFFCGALFLCVLASIKGTLVFRPSEEPKACAERFLTLATEGKDEEAVLMQSSDDSLFVLPKDPDETEKLIISKLRDSYSYTVSGSGKLNGTHASVPASVEYLDLSKLTPDLLSSVNTRLESMVETHRKSEIYDENENYREDVLHAVYEEAVEEILQKPENYLSQSDVTLEMDYKKGEWKIVPNPDLKLALAGGSTSGSNLAANVRSEVLGELTYIPKIYTIEENATMGPKPNPDKYGSTKDPRVIVDFLKNNPDLTEGKKAFFNPEAKFIHIDIEYYCDETILCYTWRELLDGHACTFAEIFIANPSQFRRKFSQDTYGSPIQKYASELSKETNAVVAMNGDFYKFRAEGMTVYQRQLYRFNPHKLELCHVNSDGDLLFTYAGELDSEETAKKYIADNDVLFTLAFGPVLVADGQPHESSRSYLLGQVTETYSRSVLARGEPNHYLLMTINHGYNAPTATIDQTRDIMVKLGVRDAYVLDGGQTAEIIMKHRVLNHIDFDAERAVSDILYFVTALPEEENQ